MYISTIFLPSFLPSEQREDGRKEGRELKCTDIAAAGAVNKARGSG
jgi:hypothetical protein